MKHLPTLLCALLVGCGGGDPPEGPTESNLPLPACRESEQVKCFIEVKK